MNRSTYRAPTKSSRAVACLSLAALSLLTFAAHRDARAATVCIAAGDYIGLQSALAAASSNGEDDLIELQIGQYSMPSNFVLDYGSPAEVAALTIEGGYSPNFGNPCGTPPLVPDPRLTVLNRGLLRMAPAGSLTLKSVTVQNTNSADANYAPVSILASASSTGDIVIENSIFTGNTSTTRPAIYVLSDQGALLVQNSLFAGNGSFSGQSAIRMGSQRVDTSFCAQIINSTFTNNASPVPSLDLYAQSCLAIVANDILWGNVPGGDIQFAYPQSAYLEDSDLGDLSEAANTQSARLLSVDPAFNPDFSLRDFSPLRDIGNSGGVVFSPGPFDVVGNPRTAGANVDIGAFEVQDVILADGFDY